MKKLYYPIDDLMGESIRFIYSLVREYDYSMVYPTNIRYVKRQMDQLTEWIIYEGKKQRFIYVDDRIVDGL